MSNEDEGEGEGFEVESTDLISGVLIKHLEQESLKSKPKPVFSRSKKLSSKDRFIALKEEVRKVMFNWFEVPSGDVNYVEYLEVKIPVYEMKKASLTKQIKFRLASINKARLGKLRWYENVYAYVVITFDSWREK